MLGSKLVNAADPAVLDGAGDAYHVSGLVWRMGHGVPVSSFSEWAHGKFVLKARKHRELSLSSSASSRRPDEY